MKSLVLLILLVASPAISLRDWQEGKNPWDSYRTIGSVTIQGKDGNEVEILALEPKSNGPARIMARRYAADVSTIIWDFDLISNHFAKGGFGLSGDPNKINLIAKDMNADGKQEIIVTTIGKKHCFTYIFSEDGKALIAKPIAYSQKGRAIIGDFDQKRTGSEVKIVDPGKITEIFAWGKPSRQYFRIPHRKSGGGFLVD